MPEPDELGPEDHGPAQWEFLAMLPRYPDGRANLSALASAATPNNPPGLPQDGHDQDVERILQRFGLDLCAPLTTYTRTQTMHHHTSLLCTKCCNHRPKPENLHSLSEFYDAMFDEDGLPFYDAPGALPPLPRTSYCLSVADATFVALQWQTVRTAIRSCTTPRVMRTTLITRNTYALATYIPTSMPYIHTGTHMPYVAPT